MWNELLSGKKAVIFDLDGTLVDSMEIWVQIDKDFLGRYGYEVPDWLKTSIEGMGFSETAVFFKEKFDLPLEIEEIKAAWSQMAYEYYSRQVQPKPGAVAFIRYLKERGMKLGIASSNSQDLIQAVLSRLGVEEAFSTILTCCQVPASKPAPDVYLETARRLGTEPADCLVFEDVPAGIKAGHAAGMTVVAVEDNYSLGMREEKAALADYLIEDYCQLLKELG